MPDENKDASEALTIIPLAPTTFSEAMEMSTVLASSKLLAEELRGKRADVLVTLLLGAEVGLSPMMSLRSIYVVKGKPTMSADLMVAICLASPLCEYFRRLEDPPEDAEVYVTRRAGDKEMRATFTMEDAEKAKLVRTDSTWTKHPKAMLRARAKSILARDVYPDLLHGFYSSEEAEEFDEDESELTAPEAPTEPAPVEDAELVDETEPAEADEEEDDLAVEIAALRKLLESGPYDEDLLSRLNKIPEGDEKADLRRIYSCALAPTPAKAGS